MNQTFPRVCTSRKSRRARFHLQPHSAGAPYRFWVCVFIGLPQDQLKWASDCSLQRHQIHKTRFQSQRKNFQNTKMDKHRYRPNLPTMFLESWILNARQDTRCNDTKCHHDEQQSMLLIFWNHFSGLKTSSKNICWARGRLASKVLWK